MVARPAWIAARVRVRVPQPHPQLPVVGGDGDDGDADAAFGDVSDELLGEAGVGADVAVDQQLTRAHLHHHCCLPSPSRLAAATAQPRRTPAPPHRALERTQRSELEEFARGVVDTQSAEIQELSGLLEAAGEDPDDMPAMDHDDADMEQMPGMMSQDDMAALEALQGPEFDLAFLRMMTEHHEGAIEMAQTVLADARTRRSKTSPTGSSPISRPRSSAWTGGSRSGLELPGLLIRRVPQVVPHDALQPGCMPWGFTHACEAREVYLYRSKG